MNEYWNKLRQASLLLERRQFQLAAEILESAITLAPEIGRAYAGLALARGGTNKLSEARELSVTAVSFSPDDDYCHFALSLTCYHLDDLDHAILSIEAALQIAPTDATYHAHCARIFLEKREWQLAIEHAERGLSHSPDHVECLNWLAQALRKNGNRERAVATAKLNLSKNVNNARAFVTLGWIALEQGQQQEAIENFQEALRINPNNESARTGLLLTLQAFNVLYRQGLRLNLWLTRKDPRVLILIFGSVLLALTFMIELPDDGTILELTGIVVSFTFVMFTLTVLFILPTLHPLYFQIRNSAILTQSERADVKYVLTAAAGWIFLCALPLATGFRILDTCSYTLLLIPTTSAFSIPENKKRILFASATLALWGIALFYASRWYFPLGIEGLKGFNPIGQMSTIDVRLLRTSSPGFASLEQSQLLLERWFTFGSIMLSWLRLI